MSDNFTENDDILNDILKETAPAEPEEVLQDVPADIQENSEQQPFDQEITDNGISDQDDADSPIYDQDADGEEFYRDNMPADDDVQLYDQDEPVDEEQEPAPVPRRKKPVKKAAEKPKKKKKKKKKKHNRLPGVLILVTLIFGVSIISSVVIISYGKDMLGINKSDSTHMIEVPEGADNQYIANLLEEKGIIKSAKAFKLFADLRNKDMTYISGSHFIRPSMAYETIINELTLLPDESRGESVQITFKEGINLIEAAAILEENSICDAEDFIFYFNAGDYGVPFEKMLPIDTAMKFQKMEGYLFPDTYLFYENSKPEEVCQKIYYNFDLKMTDDRLKRMNELGLTLDELITFASIVEKEAASVDTMKHIAGIFWNRREDPEHFSLLQSDPTTNYANNVVRPNMQYFDQTKIDAYDTYKTPGLPPGAICNPGLDAIDAVLEKYETDDYFFIANIHTGVTYYAKTNEEHEANKQAIMDWYAQEGLEYEE